MVVSQRGRNGPVVPKIVEKVKVFAHENAIILCHKITEINVMDTPLKVGCVRNLNALVSVKENVFMGVLLGVQLGAPLGVQFGWLGTYSLCGA